MITLAERHDDGFIVPLLFSGKRPGNTPEKGTCRIKMKNGIFWVRIVPENLMNTRG
jgi:hypothetical protein